MRFLLSVFFTVCLISSVNAETKAPVAKGERLVDNINLPFVDDPAVIGTWKSVDFVDSIDKFVPEKKNFKGDLYLKKLVFLKDGKTPQLFWTWTKGVLMHSGDKTASKYEIKTINGKQYLSLEWKSGDVMIRHMKPKYYVLVKQ